MGFLFTFRLRADLMSTIPYHTAKHSTSIIRSIDFALVCEEGKLPCQTK